MEGVWISDQDKKCWNEFWQMLERNACGDFSLTGKFLIYGDGYGIVKNKREVLEVFSEGEYQHYGRSISNILNIMEYIAHKVLKGELDLGLIKIQMLRFYQLANFYNDILSEEISIEFYPKCKKIFDMMIQCFKNNEPYENYCEFPIDKKS